MIPLPAVLLLAVPQQSLSYPELLKEFTELPRLAAAPQEGSRVVQFSSYDRKSQAGPGEPDAWFANDDRGHYLRVEDGPRGKEYVLAEVAARRSSRGCGPRNPLASCASTRRARTNRFSACPSRSW